MRINHNISALNTRRHLVENTRAQSKNLERLSSGLKINRGADGPAQLIISERLRSQQASLKQAIDNNEAGVTMLQTAEAALNEANRALIHIRELTVHAANEAVNDEFMLQADQQEIDHDRPLETRSKTQFWNENVARAHCSENSSDRIP